MAYTATDEEVRGVSEAEILSQHSRDQAVKPAV